LYCEQQNTKLVFQLEDGLLTKDTFEETYKPEPKPMSVYSNNYINKSLLKDYDIKEHIPKIKAVPNIVQEAVPDIVIEAVPDIVIEAVPDIVQEAVPDIVQEAVPDIVQEAIPDIVQEAIPDIVQEAVPDLVNTTHNISETDPSIYAKYFTNFDRITFSQTNIKNYTVVVHYENKTASISNSDYVQVIPIYMNVVALMNPK
jgi:hypothetical protein